MSTAPTPRDAIDDPVFELPGPEPLNVTTARLAAERRKLERVLEELAATQLDQRTEEDDLGEVASASQHPADVASETLEREVELGLIDDFRGALFQLERAEERLANGTYGTCSRCARPIGAERLAVVPATPWCLPCASEIEREARWRTPGRRPLDSPFDEEFLAPDDRLDHTDQDGERANEEAAITDLGLDHAG